MASSEPGHTALAAFDEALAHRPHKPGHGFSEAMRCLAVFRDTLVARQRAHGATPGSRVRLEQVNGVISTLLAGHFPLGPIPWPEIEAARDLLAEVLQGLQRDADPVH